MTNKVVNQTVPWMDSLFASPAQIRLLRLLSRDPGKYWTGREIAREAGMPQSTTNLVVQRLRRLNILDIRQVGPSQLFRLQTDLAIVEQVVRAFRQEDQVLDALSTELAKVVPDDAACILFGSSARGNRRRTSDVDLLVVAKYKEDAGKVAQDVRSVARNYLPFPLDVLALSRQEARGRAYRKLMENVLDEGRHLAGRPLAEVLK